MIYFDNAATTLHKPPCVIEAVTNAMTSMGNSGRAAHGGALEASRTVYCAREALARLFGCRRADHVVFTANATEALNIALFGLFSAGDRIISTDCEHNSVLRPLYALEKQGIHTDFVPADGKGCVDYDDFARLLRPETRAVVAAHASNLTGNVTDLARIGAFAHRHGLLLIVDASQTAGSLPIDMERMNIDVLCFTGHKSLMGPQGTGGLCIGGDLDIRPLKTGGTGVQSYLPQQPREMPAHLEAGTLNAHGIAGLLAAVEFIGQTGLETIHAHEAALARRFYEGVSAMDGYTVYGDFSGGERAPIVTLNLRDVPSSELGDALFDEYGIATRAGAHCAPRMHRALGTVEQGAVRFSFGYFNTFDEVDAALAALKELSVE